MLYGFRLLHCTNLVFQCTSANPKDEALALSPMLQYAAMLSRQFPESIFLLPICINNTPCPSPNYPVLLPHCGRRQLATEKPPLDNSGARQFSCSCAAPSSRTRGGHRTRNAHSFHPSRQQTKPTPLLLLRQHLRGAVRSRVSVRAWQRKLVQRWPTSTLPRWCEVQPLLWRVA